jgi:zinc protease
MMRPRLTLLAPLAALLWSMPATAQQEPAAGDTATISYEVAGVRVIHRPLAANEIVAVNLYLLGGSAQMDAQNAGIEAMLLRVSEFGTEAYPGRATRLALARTGSRTTLQTEPDWTLFGFRGVRAEFDSTWAVFAQRVMQPAIDPASVEVVRRQMLLAARRRINHPDALVRRLADSVAFAGHPYQADPDGTEASLSAITAGALRDYLESQMITSRMLLVVVGNIPRAQVEAAVERTFARLPRGSYAWSLPAPWTATRPTLTVFEHAVPTNYILGYFAGPQANSKDYNAFRIATNILGSLAHSDIRENGLSYAAGAPLLERGASGGGIYVSTTRPDTTIKIFNSKIKLLQENSVPRFALQNYYDGFITEYYGLNEGNDDQADFLARFELLRGDWRASARYMQEIRSVQGIDIRRAARQYMKNIQYVYVGDGSRAPAQVMGVRD